MNADTIWRWLLTLARGERSAGRPDGAGHEGTLADTGLFPAADAQARQLILRYLPLCRGCPERFVVGHLGQSLDGRIATANGASRWVTGPEDVLHNQRMRALFDAVVVGAGTIRSDDPELTVRAVEGPSPVRVVLDPDRRLAARYRVFLDDQAPTVVVCDAALAKPGAAVGRAEVVGAARANGRLCPRAVLDLLAARGLRRIFLEGGGVTVSHFLAARCLHRLQITVAPLIIGSGRPSITLPEIEQLSRSLRPPTRRFDLGDDILFECRLDA